MRVGTTAFDDLPSDRLHLRADHEVILKELDDQMLQDNHF